MFCPEGYETLATAYRRCGQAAAEWARGQPEIEKPKYPGLFIDTGLDEEYRRGGYREWLWRHFARHTFNQLYCVSPSGIVLGLDVESGGYFGNFPAEFPEDIEEQRKLDETAGDVFYWIDNQAFAIRALPEWVEDEFSDPAGYQQKVMAPLRGRPVLWKPPQTKLTSDEFVALILSKPSREVPAQSLRRPVGRPAKSLELRSLVLSVFSERYPNPPDTKKESVWNEAQTWVKTHAGQDVARSTIQVWLAPLWERPAGK